MSSLKVPIVVGVIGFFLIFIINLLVGNTFFITISRSFIYGLLVTGIIFGITFVFKNYLGIDLELNEIKTENDESNVDIVVGQEDDEEVDSVNMSEDETQYTGEALESENYEETGENDFSDESTYDSSGFNAEEEKTVNVKDKVVNDSYEEVSYTADIENSGDSMESFESNNSEDNESESLDRLSDMSYDSEREDDEDTEEDDRIEVSTDSLKEKIGVDVSFEDVAKAIRTKLRSEE